MLCTLDILFKDINTPHITMILMVKVYYISVEPSHCNFLFLAFLRNQEFLNKTRFLCRQLSPATPMAAASSAAVQTGVYANTDLTDQIKSASRLTIHDPKYSYRVGGVRRKKTGSNTRTGTFLSTFN